MPPKSPAQHTKTKPIDFSLLHILYLSICLPTQYPYAIKVSIKPLPSASMPSTTASKSRRGRRKWAWPCRQIKAQCFSFFALIEKHLMGSFKLHRPMALKIVHGQNLEKMLEKTEVLSHDKLDLPEIISDVRGLTPFSIPVNLDLTCGVFVSPLTFSMPSRSSLIVKKPSPLASSALKVSRKSLAILGGKKPRQHDLEKQKKEGGANLLVLRSFFTSGSTKYWKILEVMRLLETANRCVAKQ